jgi:hypothetical protein
MVYPMAQMYAPQQHPQYLKQPNFNMTGGKKSRRKRSKKHRAVYRDYSSEEGSRSQANSFSSLDDDQRDDLSSSFDSESSYEKHRRRRKSKKRNKSFRRALQSRSKSKKTHLNISKEQSERDKIYNQTMRRIQELEQTSVYDGVTNPVSKMKLRRRIDQLQKTHGVLLDTMRTDETTGRTFQTQTESKLDYPVSYIKFNPESTLQAEQSKHGAETPWNDAELVLNHNSNFKGTFGVSSNGAISRLPSLPANNMTEKFKEYNPDPKSDILEISNNEIRIVDSAKTSPVKNCESKDHREAVPVKEKFSGAKKFL